MINETQNKVNTIEGISSKGETEAMQDAGLIVKLINHDEEHGAKIKELIQKNSDKNATIVSNGDMGEYEISSIADLLFKGEGVKYLLEVMYETLDFNSPIVCKVVDIMTKWVKESDKSFMYVLLEKTNTMDAVLYDTFCRGIREKYLEGQMARVKISTLCGDYNDGVVFDKINGTLYVNDFRKLFADMLVNFCMAYSETFVQEDLLKKSSDIELLWRALSMQEPSEKQKEAIYDACWIEDTPSACIDTKMYEKMLSPYTDIEHCRLKDSRHWPQKALRCLYVLLLALVLSTGKTDLSFDGLMPYYAGEEQKELYQILAKWENKKAE